MFRRLVGFLPNERLLYQQEWSKVLHLIHQTLISCQTFFTQVLATIENAPDKIKENNRLNEILTSIRATLDQGKVSNFLQASWEMYIIYLRLKVSSSAFRISPLPLMSEVETHWNEIQQLLQKHFRDHHAVKKLPSLDDINRRLQSFQNEMTTQQFFSSGTDRKFQQCTFCLFPSKDGQNLINNQGFMFHPPCLNIWLASSSSPSSSSSSSSSLSSSISSSWKFSPVLPSISS